MKITASFKKERSQQITEEIAELENRIIDLKKEKVSLQKDRLEGDSIQKCLLMQSMSEWLSEQPCDSENEEKKDIAIDWFSQHPEITIATIHGTSQSSFEFQGECLIWNTDSDLRSDPAYDKKYNPPFTKAVQHWICNCLREVCLSPRSIRI